MPNLTNLYRHRHCHCHHDYDGMQCLDKAHRIDTRFSGTTCCSCVLFLKLPEGELAPGGKKRSKKKNKGERKVVEPELWLALANLGDSRCVAGEYEYMYVYVYVVQYDISSA
jgi:hypothetical protein